ncbi:MAG TPA: hypothetical protein VMH39_08545 [Gemmatimonadaceae bacterium]|nr:hypothetical protein [Gemmatimonadaceae bacterium]
MTYTASEATPCDRPKTAVGLRGMPAAVGACVAIVLCGSVPPRALGQTLARPLRQVGPVVAHGFRAGAGMVGLRDGEVLVADPLAGGLSLMDSTLSGRVFVAGVPDTEPRLPVDAPAPLTALIRFTGDSIVFADGATESLRLLDPAGRLARVISLPPGVPLAPLVDQQCHPGFDARGGLIFELGRASADLQQWPKVSVVPFATSVIYSAEPPILSSGTPIGSVLDTDIVVRADMKSGVVDTIASLTRARLPFSAPRRLPDGARVTATDVFPIQFSDGLAITTDGSVAVVRGRDYHIDWIDPDGTHRSTPPVAHTWQVLSSSRKAKIVDSTRAALDSVEARDASAHRADPSVQPRRFLIPSAEALPDSLPPFGENAVFADADNELWIRQSTGASAVVAPPSLSSPPQAFDIVNRSGRLVDRVEMPRGCALGGFAPGVVFAVCNAAPSRLGDDGFDVIRLRFR